MRAYGFLLLVCAATTLFSSPSFADAPTPEDVCHKIAQSTLTIRVSHPTPSNRDPNNPKSTTLGVTLASGVSLGNGLIVSFFTAPASSRIRVTLPEDGRSVDAVPVVIDRYSGLTLLKLEQGQLPALELAETTPTRGATVYTAAGSGIEEPLVSRGMLGGVNRSVGSLLPPVLACDVRTTANSSGAAMVDDQGRLIGIVVATDRNGWTYAVPVQHVQRLLKSKPAAGVVVLERRRPVLGLNLLPRDPPLATATQPETVEIARVIPKGPADKAGLKVGDLLTEVDGVKIRSVYTAQLIVLRKQPGESVTFTVRRGDTPHQLPIMLEGSGPDPEAQASLSANEVIGVPQPFAGSVIPVQTPSAQVTTSSTNSTISIHLSGSTPTATSPVTPQTTEDVAQLRKQVGEMKAEVTQRNREIVLLKAQLDGWAKALQIFQSRLKTRDTEQQQTDKALEELKHQLDQLRQATDTP